MLPKVDAFCPLSETPSPSSSKDAETAALQRLVRVHEALEANVREIERYEASAMDADADENPDEAQTQTPAVAPPVVIKRGGYILAVLGAEQLDVPFIEQEVSSAGRVANGPLVKAIEDPAKARGSRRFATPKTGLVVAATVALVAAGIYFTGVSGFDQIHGISRETTASVASQTVPDEVRAPVSTHAAKRDGVSLVDQYRNTLPRDALGDLTPRQVKIETFHVLRGEGKNVQIVKDGSTSDLIAAPGNADVPASTAARLTDDTTLQLVMPRPRPEHVKRITSGALDSGNIFKELAALRDGRRTRPVTIVHIGDSHISSDAFSRGLRDGLQAQFGDAGRGAVIPAGAYQYALADGVRMATAGDWSASNSLNVQSGPYGLSGVRVASSSLSANMTLSTTTDPFDWAEVTVLTGPEQGRVKLAAGGKTETFNAQAPVTGSTVVRVEAQGRDLVVSPDGGGETTILNWATGRERAGVRYVNFGISSATAYIQRRWDERLVANDLAHLKPDLVIWGYGTNEGFNDNLDMKSYRAQVAGIYTSFSKAAPYADWLFIGPASGLSRRGKAAGYCNGYRIPVKLAAVRETLETFAKDHGRHFWDWSEAMGGACAVDEWARATPKLAADDRVHLTARGYRKSADALVAHINELVEKPQLVAAVTPERR